MERFRELEKGFKKKQFSDRAIKQGAKGQGGVGGKGSRDHQEPRCKRRLALEALGSDEEEDMPDYDDDDEYSHGSDCNCAGDSDNDDDEYGEDDDLENQGEQEDEAISMEEAVFTVRQLVDQLAQLIGRIEGEIDKCKKARGP